MSKSDSSVSFGVGLLFGVLAGVAAGVFFAPKPGEETRKDLKEVVNKISGDTQPELTYAKNASEDMINMLKLSIEKQFLKINNAIKAGRMAAAKRKEELESGYNY